MKRFLLLAACLVAALAVVHVQVATSATPAPGRSVAQHSHYSIVGAPSLSAAFVDQVLAGARSPMQGSGAAFVRLGRQYEIDDAFVLAIFHHESNYGTTGEARVSKSPGNLRCLDQAHYSDLLPLCRDGYAWFPTWTRGLEAMYRLLAGPLYVAGGLVTIKQIIERWAPDSDGNNSAAYVADVENDIANWRAVA